LEYDDGVFSVVEIPLPPTVPEPVDEIAEIKQQLAQTNTDLNAVLELILLSGI
jgi:hypothetical protein